MVGERADGKSCATIQFGALVANPGHIVSTEPRGVCGIIVARCAGCDIAHGRMFLTMTVLSRGLYPYPVKLEEVARDGGRRRSESSSGFYSHGVRSRGSLEPEIQMAGVLAELVAIDFLDNKGKKFVATKVDAGRPVPGPDIIMEDGTRFDVKAVRKGFNLRINRPAHLKHEGRLDWYWFIKILESMELKAEGLKEPHARHWIIRYRDVKGWEIDSRMWNGQKSEFFYYDASTKWPGGVCLF